MEARLVPDIHTLVDVLRREGELVEVTAEVDTELELAEIHRRVIAANGPALLFRHPKGHGIPVATNLFGSGRRVELALGKQPAEFVARAVRLMHELVPPTIGKLWGERDFFAKAFKLGTRNVRRGPVTEVVDQPARLDQIPMFKSWSEDGGSFVTLPLVYTEHPEDGRHNLGMYRMHRHSPTSTGMHWQIGKGGGYHHHAAQQRGESLPVTVFVGGPPALILAAVAPLPENVPELMLASLMLGDRLPMADNPVGPHRLVASAEFAFVGSVGSTEVAPEGPFGDHYGYYSLQHDYPVFNVDAVCRRKDAIWPATVVGKPRQEDLYIGDYLQELLSPLFPVVMPNVRQLWSYGETGYHALAGAEVVERHGREAMSAAFRILGEGQLALTKFLWVVSGGVDLSDAKKVLPHLLARFRPETDLYVLSNLSMDTLDYTGPRINEGSKGIMLGTGDPWRELPEAFRGECPPGVERVAVFCPGCIAVQGPSWGSDPAFADRITSAFPDWPLIVLVDDAERTVATTARFLWTVFTRFEPAADIFATTQRVHRHHIVYGGTILIDARFKNEYPAELFCDPDTARRVDRRWNEYFPDKNVEMGDSDVADLDIPWT